ncbi:flowering locus K homology domain-like [Iris pallida]|uniref:Flowering locus K homology domain-like n=1 Tax=Iris pallida TaxID=29817 RepID=A0AAX6GCU5_IRIPA|nr:flowering locus K homology domain-like [Iris pallida]
MSSPNANLVEHDVAGDTDNKQNQKKGNDEDMEVGSRGERWPGWPGDSVFRILVPSHKVGGIIGHKGEIIKKMCKESRARIKILDGPQGVSERAVIVSAKEEQDAVISPAMDGLLRIHKCIIDGLDGEARPQNAGNMVITRLLVGTTQGGILIGKQGESIKSIREASNTVVRLVSTDLPPFALQDDKIIEIQGEPAGVHKALELIASHLRKFLVDHSVLPLFEIHMSRSAQQMQNIPPPQHWGHPLDLPPIGVSRFGGDTDPMPLQPYGSFYPPPGLPPFETPLNHSFYPLPDLPPSEKPPNHSLFPPFDLPPFEKPPNRSVYSPLNLPPFEKPPNCNPSPDLPLFEKQPDQCISASRSDAQGVVVHWSNHQDMQQLASQDTLHMEIPVNYADAVIGASGENISYIRRASGATIKIRETRGVPGEMTVEINGSATQRQTAQHGVQNFIAEAAAAPAQSTVSPVHQGYESNLPGRMHSAPPVNAGPTVYIGRGYGSSCAANHG